MRLVAGEPAARHAIVLLDGIERNNVIEADEERRYIVRIRTDEHGQAIPNEDRTAFLTETLRGDVFIRRGPPVP